MTTSGTPSISLLHRLKNVARNERVDAQLIQSRYVAERLLDRLARSPYRDKFVLKGAMLYVVWKGDAYRATRDLDLFGDISADPVKLVEIFREICAISSSDSLSFPPDAIRAEAIRETADYGGIRVHLVATIGRTRLPLVVDIGFGNAIEPAPRLASFPAIFDDAAPRVFVYPREAAVAEKLQTVVALGEANSRLKDYYDLYVWSHRFPFDGSTLARSVAATFQRRHTEVPAGIPPSLTAAYFSSPTRNTEWRAYLKAGRLDGAPSDFASVGESLGMFANPVLNGIAMKEEFDRGWEGGGPWR